MALLRKPASKTTITQTYATPATTHAALTAVALTDSSGGTTDGELDAVGATNSGDVSGDINNNFAELAEQLAAVIADLTNVKGVLNSVVDILQSMDAAL